MRAWEWFFWHLHGMRKPSINSCPFKNQYLSAPKKKSLIFIQVISSSHLSSVQCHPSTHWWPSSRLLPHQNRRWCQCSRCNQNGWRALSHPVPGLESSRRVSAAPHLGFLAAPTKRVDFSWEKWGDFQMTWDEIQREGELNKQEGVANIMPFFGLKQQESCLTTCVVLYFFRKIQIILSRPTKTWISPASFFFSNNLQPSCHP